MYKSQKTSPCTKCSNHGKTVVNHCPYWDCQCTSCKQTDILAALKLEHSQLMRGLNPGSLQKISITENQKESQDTEGTQNNNRSEEPKSLLDSKVKMTDERKMGNIEPVKFQGKKSLVGVDENENCVRKNDRGKSIKRESDEHRKDLKQESKDVFDIKSEYIEFETDISESLAKTTAKTLGIKDEKKSCSLGVRGNGISKITEYDGNPSQDEGTHNLNPKLSIASSKSVDLLDTSKRNTINSTHPHLGVKELPTVNPKRETVIEKDPSKTQCPQSSFVTPIGILGNFTSLKGIKMEEIDNLPESEIFENLKILRAKFDEFESKIVESLMNLKDIKTEEDSGLENLKDIKTEVQKNDTKKTDKFLCTQYLITNKEQEMQKHSPSQSNEKNVKGENIPKIKSEKNVKGEDIPKIKSEKNEKMVKVEGITKIKSEVSTVPPFDIAEENVIENSINLARFLTMAEQGEHIGNVTNALDPLTTVEFKVQKIEEVEADTVQFQAGNANDPDLKRLKCLNNEKKQLGSKCSKFDQRKMPDKPKRRVYIKQNPMPRFKIGGKDRRYREGDGSDVSGYGGGGGSGGYSRDRDNSGYSVGNLYGGDYRGYKRKGRWGGNDEYDGVRDSCGYKENMHGMAFDGGGGRYKPFGEYGGGGYQGDVGGINNGGYRSEYGKTDYSGHGDSRNSEISNGGGGRDGGGFEESRRNCGVYGKGKDGVRDYGRNGRGGGYGGGGQY